MHSKPLKSPVPWHNSPAYQGFDVFSATFRARAAADKFVEHGECGFQMGASRH
jgi:hypothetical protein